MDQIRYLKACNKIIDADRVKNGIGTLGEKTVHAVLKNYFEPDESKQEVRIGNYVADICSEAGIIEIQTRNFNTLRKKLSAFLETGPVTVVYPIPYIKWLRWIDEETGETTDRRKSPKKGTPYAAFYELYKIKEHLLHPNFNLCLILIDMEEYRLLNGWSRDRKKGSTRYDRVPLGLKEEIWIQDRSDYKRLIPDSLEEEFVSRDYKKASGLSLSQAQTALNVLYYTGAVERTGKKGNAYCYKRSF